MFCFESQENLQSIARLALSIHFFINLLKSITLERLLVAIRVDLKHVLLEKQKYRYSVYRLKSLIPIFLKITGFLYLIVFSSCFTSKGHTICTCQIILLKDGNCAILAWCK